MTKPTLAGEISNPAMGSPSSLSPYPRAQTLHELRKSRKEACFSPLAQTCLSLYHHFLEHCRGQAPGIRVLAGAMIGVEKDKPAGKGVARPVSEGKSAPFQLKRVQDRIVGNAADGKE